MGQGTQGWSESNYTQQGHTSWKKGAGKMPFHSLKNEGNPNLGTRALAWRLCVQINARKNLKACYKGASRALLLGAVCVQLGLSS